MHISNDLYFQDRRRHDLALRMIRHEARTCTIRACTGLTEDRIRRLCKTYEVHCESSPLRRRRGKSPRQIAYFTRNAHLQFESSCLLSMFTLFGLSQRPRGDADAHATIEYGSLFCDAFETHRQVAPTTAITFEHAWFLLQQMNDGESLLLSQCRQCHGQFLRDSFSASPHACPMCRLKRIPARRRCIARASSPSNEQRALIAPCKRKRMDGSSRSA